MNAVMKADSFTVPCYFITLFHNIKYMLTLIVCLPPVVL